MLISPESLVTFFTALCIALSARFTHAMTLDQISRVNKAATLIELDLPEVQKTLAWLEELQKTDPKDADIPGSRARLIFLVTTLETDKEQRIKKYQTAINTADESLKLDSQNIIGNFWKAAALGKQGLDMGTMKSLNNARMMRTNLELVEKTDEKYEHAAAHRALGRLFYKLPGWPISFGSNSKSFDHLKRAVELAPEHVGNHAFYAEVLIKLGKKEEARKELDIVKQAPVPPGRSREFSEYLDLQKELEKKL